MHTRTHTVFFDEDSLKPLRAALFDLRLDFEKRKPYIDNDMAERFDARLTIAESAAKLLGEWAD